MLRPFLLPATTALLVCACSGIPGDPPRGEAPDTETLGELEQALVDTHNAARGRVEPAATPPLGAVGWDADIAVVAQAWAERCVFEHSDGTGYGENLALFSPRAIDADLATVTVELWESEAADYDYEGDSCAPGRQCGHYTQVVWRDTAFVGCGIASCDDVPGFGPGIMFVCNYDPPGNFIGERPY
jgi:pathogenesis-related protein 1